MKLRTQVKRAIDAQQVGQLFNIEDVAPPGASLMEASKSLSLYYRRGLVARLTKGLYYKPQKSPISGRELPPSFDSILNKVKELQGARVWYTTGVTAYNSLLLTTQVSSVLEIATDKPRTPIRVMGTTFKFVKSRIPISIGEPKLAQILDALKDIQIIPDASPKRVCVRIATEIRVMTSDQRATLFMYAQYYPPRVRALLGFCFDMAGHLILAQKIREGLAKTKVYQVGFNSREFTTSFCWNIR